MRVGRCHPVANWLRCGGNLYQRTMERVLGDRDEAVAQYPEFSGLPETSRQWFWREQLPSLLSDSFYRSQAEQRAESLQLVLLALDNDISAATDGLRRERAAAADELKKLQALLGDQ